MKKDQTQEKSICSNRGDLKSNLKNLKSTHFEWFKNKMAYKLD